MKSVLAAGVLFLLTAGRAAPAQTPIPTQPPTNPQIAQPLELNAILSQIQQATSSANANIGHLRIEKWKADVDQKRQTQQVAESLQKNITNAVPGMISAVQSNKGSVTTSFKLYHNLNVVYENLIYLADVTGSLGKREEFEPLNSDIVALEAARKNLSAYIEDAAVKMEAANRQAGSGTVPLQARQNPGAPVPGKKIVIDDDQPAPKKPVKPTKKKTSAPPSASPTPTPSSPR
jgi:hypothetical protein